MISTMRTPRRCEIFYIDKNPNRPTYGSTQEPGRPAIIVSNNLNNAHAFVYEIVYLTTQPKKDLPTHCTIRSAKYPSVALCEQITTVSDEQVRDYQGKCTEEEMAMVDACLAISLGLDIGKEVPAEEPTESYEEEETEGYDYEDDYTEGELDEITRMEKEIEELKMALTKAQKGEELMKELYNELLMKTIAK